MAIITPIIVALSISCLASVISLDVTRRLALVWGYEGVFLVWWGSLWSGIRVSGTPTVVWVVRWVIMRWESTHPVLRWSTKGIGRARWVEELSEVGKGDGGEEPSDD